MLLGRNLRKSLSQVVEGLDLPHASSWGALHRASKSHQGERSAWETAAAHSA